MKKFYSLALVLLTAVTVTTAQTVKTWVGPATGGSWTTNSNWSGNSAPSNGQIVVFNDGVSGTITNVPNRDLAGLRIEGFSNITLTVTNDRDLIIVGAGSNTPRLVIEEGSSLTIQGGGNDFVLGLERSGGGGNLARARIDGTLVLNNGAELEFDETNTEIVVNGAIENNNGASINSIATRLKFRSGSFYRHQRNGSSIPAAEWDPNSTVEILGVTNSLPSRLNQQFGNVVWNSPNQNTQFTLNDNLNNIHGNFTVASTGSSSLRWRNSGGTTTVDIRGDFNMLGGTMILSGNGNVNFGVRGNVNIEGGTISRTGGTSNFNFDSRNEVRTFTKSGGTISGQIAFYILDDAIVDFGTSVLNGTAATFRAESGSKIITSNDNGLRSSGSVGSIQVGGSRSFSSGATYEFRGARTGTFTTYSNDVAGLIFNNPNGEVLVERPFDVTGSLQLMNGYATNDNSTRITVNNGASMSSSNGGYVNGYLAKIQNSNTAITFYVGNPGAGGLRPITLDQMQGSNTTTFVARFVRASATSITNGTSMGPGISRVSGCEYWVLDRSSGNRTGRVTLNWAPESECSGNDDYVTNTAMLRVARHNGTSWVSEGGDIVGGSNSTSGSIRTSARVNNFSPFALASTSITDNPLPVLFADVRAFAKNNGVQIEWSNLTERDVIDYKVEHSTNGVEFAAINTQLPKSNRDDKASYDFFHSSVTSSTNYYRIRVQEADGKAVYSKILRVELNNLKNVGVSLYPNPVTGRQFTVSLSGLDQGRYSLQVYSAAGQQVYSSTINNVGAGVTQMVELPANVKTGVYMTVITGDNFRESRQIIVK